MTFREAVWNSLTPAQRKLLLVAVYPNRSAQLDELEASKKWGNLLPSTQQDLANEAWAPILGVKDLRTVIGFKGTTAAR